MINVAAIRMQQFGVRFYQASLTAGDIDKLVRFEVLNYGDSGQPVRGGNKKTPSSVALRRVRRRISDRSSGEKSTNSSSITSSAGKRAIFPPSPGR